MKPRKHWLRATRVVTANEERLRRERDEMRGALRGLLRMFPRARNEYGYLTQECCGKKIEVGFVGIADGSVHSHPDNNHEDDCPWIAARKLLERTDR